MPGVSISQPPSTPSPSPVDSPNFRVGLQSVQKPWKQNIQKMQSGFENFVACLQTEEERQEDAWDHNVFLSAGVVSEDLPYCTMKPSSSMTRSVCRHLHPALINHPALDLSYDFGDLDAEEELLVDISSSEDDSSDGDMSLSESVWQAILVINCDLVINALLNEPEASPGSLTACSGPASFSSSASTAYYCSLESWEKSDGSSSTLTSDLRTDSLGIDTARFEESRRIVVDLQDLAQRLKSEGVTPKRQYDDFGTGVPSSAPCEAWLLCPSSPTQMSSSEAELTDISYHTSFCSSDTGVASDLDFAFPILMAPASSPTSDSVASGPTLPPWDL